MAVTSSGMLESLKWDSVKQLAYSPDLAPADFHIFGLLKKDLAGLHFYTLLFHSLFKVKFDINHFVLGENWER